MVMSVCLCIRSSIFSRAVLTVLSVTESGSSPIRPRKQNKN